MKMFYLFLEAKREKIRDINSSVGLKQGGGLKIFDKRKQVADMPV